MATSVLAGTAIMRTLSTGATPGVSFTDRGGVQMAVLHLTRHAGSLVRGTARSAAGASAIHISGSVSATIDSGDSIFTSFAFQFLQVFYDVANIAFYAGKTPSEGSMSLDFTGSRYFRGHGRYMLDADPNGSNRPFSNVNKFTADQFGPYPTVQLAKVAADDHPFKDYPIRVPNAAAGDKWNYLYRVVREFRVITTFLVQDTQTYTRLPLAHVKWGSSCEARLHWSLDNAGTEQVDSNPNVTGSFTADAVSTQGPPTEPGLKDIILNATMNDDTYNAAAEDATRALLGGTVADLDLDLRQGWSPQVPTNHFKP